MITTDWSGAISEILPPGVNSSPPSLGAALDAFRDGEFFVFQVAGSIWTPPAWIGAEDMRQLAVDDREYARFIVSLLSTRSLLFVGSDVQAIEEFLDCFPWHAESDRSHWALVPWEPRVELDRERLERRYRVHLLSYPPEAPFGVVVERFLRSLLEQLPRRSSGKPAASGAEQLRELRLQNIGPFTELQLDFDRHTVLLGDNGSGKSSVLRAIALALSGETADSHAAQRMLKTTATRGEIELATDRGRYRTRIVGGEGLRTRIETDGLPPIEASGWLALGFPPLRGVSLSNPRGPTGATTNDPTPDDLLPLLSNGPDERMDALKQWVVNTAMRAEGRTPQARRESQLLERFFTILEDLTPGNDFTYQGINRKTWEVKLDSPDGPVSFDLLSRGMTALMGWVGVLLQRLYEVHGDGDGRSEEQRALVLVDEIDVHLHPEWQHLVLPLISRHFPNIQLVVTTHSPLIVGNAKHGSVRLLSRVDGTPVVHRLDAEFVGWRSDQILTSPAFGLETTRDTATAARHREYRDLLARGQTPDVDERARELQEQIEAKMPSEEETPVEREAVKLFEAWLGERLRDRPQAERDQIIGEAESYLARLYSGEDR